MLMHQLQSVLSKLRSGFHCCCQKIGVVDFFILVCIQHLSWQDVDGKDNTCPALDRLGCIRVQCSHVTMHVHLDVDIVHRKRKQLASHLKQVHQSDFRPQKNHTHDTTIHNEDHAHRSAGGDAATTRSRRHYCMYQLAMEARRARFWRLRLLRTGCSCQQMFDDSTVDPRNY